MTSGLFKEKDMTSQPAVVSRYNFLCLVAAAAAFSPGFLRAGDDKPPDLLIGYSSAPTCRVGAMSITGPGAPSSPRRTARAGVSWPRS